MGFRATMYMVVRKAIISDWNVTRMKRKLTMTMFWEITIESKLLNQFQWSLYHSFQMTMFYLAKSKYVLFSNIKVTKIGRSDFWGDTRYKWNTCMWNTISCCIQWYTKKNIIKTFCMRVGIIPQIPIYLHFISSDCKAIIYGYHKMLLWCLSWIIDKKRMI